MKTGEQDCEMVWVNGKVIRSSEAMISVTAQGLTVGLGCFETMCVERGRFFRFSEHYSRLCRGAEKLGLTLASEDELKLGVLRLIEVNGYQMSSCRVRVSCYLDDGSTRSVITASAMPVRESSSTLVLSPYRVNEYSALVGVKSSSYAMNLIALREAEQLGADEALMLNTRGELCEGATSNFFLVKGDEILTPTLASGCLPGVAREAVIELCHEMDIACFERALSLADLDDCDGAFLTSSLRRIQPITYFDGSAVNTTETVTKLQSAYEAKIHGSK